MEAGAEEGVTDQSSLFARDQSGPVVRSARSASHYPVEFRRDIIGGRYSGLPQAWVGCPKSGLFDQFKKYLMDTLGKCVDMMNHEKDCCR